MLFNSLSFVLFFAVVFIVYNVIPKKTRAIWLLLVSFAFYMNWNASYGALLLTSIIITYTCGLLVPKLGKGAIVISLLTNFGMLFIYKYLEFALGSIDSLAGFFCKNSHLADRFDIVIPVGISFYVFQAVGYTIDVYRKEIEPEKNFIHYALFVSFFPQLVAGPIERSGRLISQVKNLPDIKAWDFNRFRTGFMIALYGYVMKMVIADRAAIYVDSIYNLENYTSYVGFTVAVAVILFAIQIYCDFAGYTYIAIGVAKILGIDLCNNFAQPYMAESIREFWNRWHISLSSWFKDYLYFPLGGSRKGKVRKYINLFIVFLVSGLWHGAAWHFVLWGAVHGIGRVVEEIIDPLRSKVQKFLVSKNVIAIDNFSFKLWKIFLTDSFVALAWVFFRAENFVQAKYIFRSMLVFNPWVLTDGSLLTHGLDGKEWNVLLIAILLIIIVDIFKYKGFKLTAWFEKQNIVFRWMVILGAIFFILINGIYGPSYDATQFIYFQF